MMKKILILLLVSILFIYCKQNEKTTTNEIVTNNKKDTVFVKENQVLFISPSLSNINEMKNEQGEDFYTIADDMNFYSANAFEFLDSIKVSYINVDSDHVIAYKKNGKTFYILPLQSKWYSLFNRDGKLIEVDLVNFKEDYKNITSLKNDNVATLLEKNRSKPDRVIEDLVFTKDNKGNLQVNTEILDYISKTTTRENGEYLFALEKYHQKYYNKTENWNSDEFVKIQAYIFNTTYPLLKKYWSDKSKDWYNGKPEYLLGSRGTWSDNQYYNIPNLEENVYDFIEILKETGRFTQFYCDGGRIPGTRHASGHADHLHGN